MEKNGTCNQLAKHVRSGLLVWWPGVGFMLKGENFAGFGQDCTKFGRICQDLAEISFYRRWKKNLTRMRQRQWNLTGILMWIAKKPSNGRRTHRKQSGRESFHLSRVRQVSSSLTCHSNWLHWIYIFQNLCQPTSSLNQSNFGLDDDGSVSLLGFNQSWIDLLGKLSFNIDSQKIP